MNYLTIVRAVSELWPLFGVTNTIASPPFYVPFSAFSYMGKS